MDFNILHSLGALGGGIAGYVVPFLFVLTIVVFFHELGHFLIARWCGVRIMVFSVGFGPEIVGFTGSLWNPLEDRGRTAWGVCEVLRG